MILENAPPVIARPVRVVFPHWVEAISTIVNEIATQ
jgi:hypothetical protein